MRLRDRWVDGDKQERVKDAPPVRFGEVFANGLCEGCQGSHEPGGEFSDVQVARPGDAWTACRNLAERVSRTNEAGTSGAAVSPAA